jgi:hypothetical protein
MTKRIAQIAVCSLIVLFSACNMNVQITTKVNDKGGGTLGLTIVLDKELRDVLEGSNGGQGLTSLESLFGRLHDEGWATSRTEPSGGLDLRATRAFSDKKSFATAMSELSTGSAGGASPLGGYSLGFTSQSSFLKTRTDFSGRVDTSSLRQVIAAVVTHGNQTEAKAFLDAASDNFQFEIRASLPGSVSVKSGDGTVTNGVAVWRPALGSILDFSATSSAIKTSSLLLVGLPGLLILAGLGWFIIGRRQRPLIAEAPTPADRRRDRIKMPQPVEQLLAIVPDPQLIAEHDTVIELDVPEPVQPAEPTA